MDLDVILTDLAAKYPYLQCILRSEYAPYFNTAGTILLGWLIVCSLSQILWALLAPLTVTIIAIIIVCPTTMEWCVKQFNINLVTVVQQLLEKYQYSSGKQ